MPRRFQGYDLEWLGILMKVGFLGCMFGSTGAGLLLAIGSRLAEQEAALTVAKDEGCLTYPVGCQADVYRMIRAAALKANQEFHNAHDFSYAVGVLAFSFAVGIMSAHIFYRPGQNQEDSSSDSESGDQADSILEPDAAAYGA